MIVNAYRLIAGAPICIQPTVAEIFRLTATRIRLIGKKKKFNDNDMAMSKCPGMG
jgi:hypothetical protein